jgi:hypothetical protein
MQLGAIPFSTLRAAEGNIRSQKLSRDYKEREAGNKRA